MKRFIPLIAIVLSFVSCKTASTVAPENLAPVDEAVETKIDTSSVYFNSRDPFCKTPFGAVVQGTETTFRILARHGDLKKAMLIVSTQNIIGNATMEKYKEIARYPMTCVGETNGLDVWTVQVKLDKIGVYGYCFELYKTDSDGIVYADNHKTVDVPYVKVIGTGGIGMITGLGKYKLPYTLTVYTNNYGLAPWTSDMTIYYIFPDRFRNGNTANDPVPGRTLFYNHRTVEFHTNWCDPKPYRPGDGHSDNDYCNDFYGGDLDGVIQKLDYIRGLGVNVIYLNPIFKAPSNHKYDTADYMQIDPGFGTLDTFKKLCSEALKRDIRIILDTSLNHCGSDSVYMDRFSKYPTLGAFEGEHIQTNSPYYTWFEWHPRETNPAKMYGQWANDTLANLNEVDSYKDFAFRGDNSVTKYWMRMGASGWRMDVTPWVSDQFWMEWRKELKKAFPGAMTFAEVWFDASKYLYGDKFDSTMNYIFRSALINFANGKKASDTVDALEMMRENYPKPVFYRLMNLTSSHDLPRTLWEVGYKEYGMSNYSVCRKKLLLTVAIQFTYPGAPTIYYGDEVGMTGGSDPFNRGPYPWSDRGCTYGDLSLLDVYKGLSAMRQKYAPVFVTGELAQRYSDAHVIVFERWDAANPDGRAVVLLNNASAAQTVNVTGLTAGTYLSLVSGTTNALGANSSLTVEPRAYEILLKI